MCQHLIFHFPLYYVSGGCLPETKKKIFKLLPLKVVAVAYKKRLPLKEVPNIVIQDFWYFRKLVAYEK